MRVLLIVLDYLLCSARRSFLYRLLVPLCGKNSDWWLADIRETGRHPFECPLWARTKEDVLVYALLREQSLHEAVADAFGHTSFWIDFDRHMRFALRDKRGTSATLIAISTVGSVDVFFVLACGRSHTRIANRRDETASLRSFVKPTRLEYRRLERRHLRSTRVLRATRDRVTA